MRFSPLHDTREHKTTRETNNIDPKRLRIRLLTGNKGTKLFAVLQGSLCVGRLRGLYADIPREDISGYRKTERIGRISLIGRMEPTGRATVSPDKKQHTVLRLDNLALLTLFPVLVEGSLRSASGVDEGSYGRGNLRESKQQLQGIRIVFTTHVPLSIIDGVSR